MLTYKELKKRLRRAIWVTPGEPSNLVAAHDIMFLEAMVEIGKWCELNRLNNSTVYNACSTLVQCGLTVFDAPPGIIRRIYTVANDDWCDLVPYEKTDHSALLCWRDQMLRCITWAAPANVGLPALQQGFRYAETSTDSTNGRARKGIWSYDRKRIYIGPWIQSNEKVVVKWDGWKQDWKDDDVVDTDYWGIDIQAAIKAYVKWRHECDFGCDEAKTARLQEDWQAKLADVMYWDKEKRRGNVEKECLQTHLPDAAEIADDAVPDEPGATTFAMIGDFGVIGTPTEQVADMVKGWKPEFIVTTGDNWYGSALTRADLDNVVGRYYADYIGKYSGAWGAGATRQNFYPSFGDHDIDPVGRLPIELDYFNIADHQIVTSDIRPFYTFIRGPVQFFVLDQGFNQSDVNVQTTYGNTPSSAQAEWLRVALALSTSRWKVVVLGAAPFTSHHTTSSHAAFDGSGGFTSYPDLRWPFKQWGADVVVYGDRHWYERLLVDDLTYIGNGAGGNTLIAENGAALDGSVIIYADDYGAQQWSADCNTLTAKFYNRSAELIDTWTLEKT